MIVGVVIRSLNSLGQGYRYSLTLDFGNSSMHHKNFSITSEQRNSVTNHCKKGREGIKKSHQSNRGQKIGGKRINKEKIWQRERTK